MKLVAVAAAPAIYHAPIYRRLASRLNGEFLAIFETAGYARTVHDPAWQTSVHFDTGLLEGYPSVLLTDPSQPTTHWGRSTRALLRLAETLKRTRPDAILLNTHRGSLCSTALAVARATGATTVLRSTPYDPAPLSARHEFARTAYLRQKYAFFDAFCAVGTLPRLHYERFSQRPKDVYFAPYCTDEDSLLPQAERRTSLRREFRADHGLDPNDFLFLFCGRLAAVKRIDWLLRAFTRIRPTSSTKLVIAGSGPQHSLLDNLHPDLSKNIITLGFQGRSGVAKAMAASDCLLLPSWSETWGVVVNEALQFRLPVVASDGVASAPDLIVHDVTGFVFPRLDFEAFTSCMRAAQDLGRRGVPESVTSALTSRFSASNATAGILAAAGIQ